MPADPNFNPQSGLYEYPTPDIGVLKSKVPRTAEEVARRADSLRSKPLPDANATMAGVAPGSPTVNAAKAAAEIAIPAIGAAAGPAIAGGSLLNRAASAALGGMGGQLLVKPASQGRMPTSNEMLAEAFTAGAGEGMASAIIRGPSEAEQIGVALRKMAGVGDTAIKFGSKGETKVLGDITSDLGASRTIVGRDTLAALPKMTTDINKHEQRLYTDMAHAADADGVRITIPSKAQRAASTILHDLGNPEDHVDVAGTKRLQKLLQRIVRYGDQPSAIESRGAVELTSGTRPERATPRTLSVREYQGLLREVRDLAPNYQDRLMPGDFEDGVMNGLNRELSNSLEASVKGTRAEQMLHDAKRYHQDVKVRFRDNVLKVLSPAEAGGRYTDVMDLLVHADNPTNLTVAMKHLPPELKQNMRQSWLNHNVIQPATDARTGLFDAKTALTSLQKLSPETRNALFDGAGRDVETIIERLAQDVKYREGIVGKTMAVGKAGIPISVGMFMLAQGNIIGAGTALTGGAIGLGGLSYILASRRLARYFARGLETPTGSQLARRYGQLIMHGLPGEVLQILSAPSAEPGSPRAIGQQFPQYPQPPTTAP